LIADGRIPPLVAALVGNVDGEPEARLRELACSEPFTRFLATELLPWVRGQANVAADPARTVVGGASLGGLASAFAALRCPDHFGNVLAQSGSFWWRPEGDREHEWLAREFAAAPRLPLRFALEVGRLEAHPTPGGGPTQVQSSRHLRDVLRARGYPVAYAEHNGGHNFLSWRGTLADSLIALLGEATPGGA
ncbi:MAG: hypothetical protein IRY97_02320, partial [Thermomicrobiaceae bacterium]|nr:hypothetical protein [Thermomicrobiaceae bacterium]